MLQNAYHVGNEHKEFENMSGLISVYTSIAKTSTIDVMDVKTYFHRTHIDVDGNKYPINNVNIDVDMINTLVMYVNIQVLQCNIDMNDVNVDVIKII